MRLRRSVAGIGVLGLVASLGVITVPALADDPPATVVFETDFSGETIEPWVQSGTPTLSFVEVDGDTALSVGDRDADFVGIETPEGWLTEGQDYTFEMRVRLAEGTPGSADVRWVMKPAFDWGGNTAMTADEWTTVTHTYTAPAEGQVYIGTGDLSGGAGAYTYLVDSIRVTAADPPPPPADPNIVYTTSFEEGSTDGWVGRGDASVAVSDAQANTGEHSLLTTGRTDSWQGPGLDLLEIDGIETGSTYDVEAYVRLAEGSGTANLALNRVPGDPGDGNEFPWIQGNVNVDADSWTRLHGSFTVETDMTTLTLFLETASTVDFYIDDITLTLVPPPVDEVDLSFDFEDGTLQGWTARDAGGNPTVDVTTEEARGTYAALVSDREGQGDGIGYDVSEVFQVGGTYDITAWVKMGAGHGTENIWLTIQTGDSTFSTIGQFTGIHDGEFQQVSASYTFPGGEMAFMYFETEWPDGGSGDFLVDDITIRSQAESEIEDLPSIFERHVGHFPVGVAIDQRETLGSAADLTTLHFNHVTAENHMKPEAWYDGEGNFRMHPQAEAIMDFAQANDLGVYGHVLVWHGQTPDWFFEDDAGQPLTDSPADQEILRQRMRDHIFNVAQTLSDEYGPFGSETNPLNAWDVVNEVVSDSGEHADGLRRSRWYEILGPTFIDLAFEYADEAFNDVHAAPDADRPVKLFINDYNTEQGGKQNRYYALVERLVADGVPIDGVGHQFHVSLSMPIAALEAAIVRFQDFDLLQAVTEMDVTVGTPVTEANIIEQGFYYRDAFRLFREYDEDLHIVTLWGLHDGRSWRSAQAPLPFDAQLQAKPGYHGIMDADLPGRPRTALVFQGEPEVSSDGVDSVVWEQLPLHEVDQVGRFQLRWMPTHLTAYVEVDDPSVDATDQVTFVFGDQSATLGRDGSTDGDVGQAHVEEVDGGYVVLAELALDSEASVEDEVDFDADNPGLWMVHCHNLYHMATGMMSELVYV
jgi:endo-1,4-beta-xylanase